MSFSVYDLKYYMEVTRTLNISRAAERLGISQPALSQAIKRLEIAFDSALLERSRSGIQLTKSGSRLAKSAHKLIEDFENLKSEIVNDSNDVTGHYTLGCHPSVAQYTVPYFMPTILKKYPKLHIEFKHYDLSRTVAAEVIDFKLDFGIVVNPTRNPDLVITELCKDFVGFWRTEKLTEANDFESDSCNLFFNENIPQTKTLLQKLKTQKVNWGRTIQSNSLEAIAALAASGAGVGIVPGKVVQQIAPNKLKLIEGFPVYKDEISLVYRPTKTKAAKAIIEEIRAAMK